MAVDLKLIPASAGSGKTYTLKELLRRGLMGQAWEIDPDNAVNPRVLPKPLRAERIVAVTFTEAAAAELRERIRGALMQERQMEAAALLDEAYVSTIHGFGFRVLRESAFEEGLALNPRLLTDDEQQLLIRKALGTSDLITEIASDLKRYGYSYDFNSGMSAEDTFRAQLLKVIGLLRSVGGSAQLEALLQQARTWVMDRYGKPAGETAEELAATLKSAVTRLLNEYPEALTAIYGGTNKSARADFDANYAAMKRAVNGTALLSDWKLWQSLTTLRISNKSIKLPQDYDDLAKSVMQAAGVIARHPGPLATAQQQIEVLLRSASEAMQEFDDEKRNAGLLDFSDMVAGAYKALCKPSIAEQLSSRVDCLVIDEFQDTNPIQFGLLWQLIRMGHPSVIVGDTKQSIMGFQGADPRLFKALEQNFPDQLEGLHKNWRSRPELLKFINAVTARLYPDYQPLEPGKKPASELAFPALHVLAAPNATGTKTHPWRAARVAEAIRRKLNDPDYVIADRHTNEQRRIRGGDCAVLCPTHSMLAQYAQALREQGLPVRLREEGWLDSSEIVLAMQALALAHDPEDKHARLYLAVTAFGQHSLEEALETLVKKKDLSDPCFTPLLALADWANRAPVDEVVTEVLRAIGIYEQAASWVSERQARANLLRLEGLAREFVELQPESLIASGIYGKGLPQFLSWVRMRAESENMMPAASIVDDQAIELVTWHASKGREWPIVAVCGMSQAVKASLPDLRLGYSSFDDLDSLIESANIEYSPSLDSKDAGKRFVDLLQPDREDQVMREIYVAISRPRDQLLLEWPLSAVESESTSRASLLEGKAKLTLNEDSINVAGGEAFPAIVERPAADGEVQTEGVTNSLLLPKHGLRAIKQCQYTGALTPDSRAPSSRHEEVSEEVSVQWEAIQYAEPLVLPEHADYLAVGDFVHRVFELGTENEQAAAYLRSKAEALWPEQAEEVLSLASASKVSFDAMLVATYQPTDTSVEVPIIGLDTNNTVVNGVVDMLVKGPEGTLIIDHKTDRERDLGVVFQRHIRQLSDYADLLSKQGNTEVAVNAVMSGVLLSAKVDGKRRITD